MMPQSLFFGELLRTPPRFLGHHTENGEKTQRAPLTILFSQHITHHFSFLPHSNPHHTPKPIFLLLLPPSSSSSCHRSCRRRRLNCVCDFPGNPFVTQLERSGDPVFDKNSNFLHFAKYPLGILNSHQPEGQAELF